MKTLLDLLYLKFTTFVQHFGFGDVSDFAGSLFHPKLILLTLPSTIVSFSVIAAIEMWFGLSYMALVGFVILAGLELTTGLWASRVKKIPWKSSKVGRFGLKIIVYLLLMLVVNVFKLSFVDSTGYLHPFVETLFYSLHTLMAVFVSFEYIISVLENLSAITGKSNNKLLLFMKKKFDQLLGVADDMTTPKIIENNEEPKVEAPIQAEEKKD